jgi:hypothetical protein
MSEPLLEQRIASALASEEIKATALAELIVETQTAIDAADRTAEEERNRALDPALSPDPKAARAAMEDAQFAADRLRTLLPRLQARHSEVGASEHLAAWREEFARVQAERDKLVEELRTVYPAVVEQLVDLFRRIAAIDQEVSHVNRHRPAGTSNHLHTVEREARGHLERPDIPLTGNDGLRLPVLHRNCGPIFAWPLPQPSLAAQMASAPVPRGIAGPDWHSLIDERDCQRREESESLSAFYEKREREAEKRREAELRAAREADRREYGY